MIPGFLSEFLLAPKSLYQFYFRPGVFWHQDRNNIKAIHHFANSKDLAINLCGSRDLPLFAKIDTVHYTQMSRVLRVAYEYATRLLAENYTNDKATEIAEALTQMYPEHGFVIDMGEACALGLQVKLPSADQIPLFNRLACALGEITLLGEIREARQ